MTLQVSLVVGGLIALVVAAALLGSLASVLLGVGLAAATAGVGALGLGWLLDPGEAEPEQR